MPNRTLIFTVACSVTWNLNGREAGGDTDLTIFVIHIKLLYCYSAFDKNLARSDRSLGRVVWLAALTF